MISINFIVTKENLLLIDSKLDFKCALKKIEEGNFLSLPVVDENKFVGVISKERILKIILDKNTEDIAVEDIMRTDIPSLTLSDEVEDAALLLAESNIPFVVIKDKVGDFLGIITHKTIFRHYTHLLGMDKGHKLLINTYDIKGRLALLTDVISKEGANIISLVIDDPHVPTKVVKIIVRIETNRLEEVKRAIEESGFSIR